MPLYQLFYDGKKPREAPLLPKGISADSDEWGKSGDSARFLHRLRTLLGRISEVDRKLIMHMTFQLLCKNRPDPFSELRHLSPFGPSTNDRVTVAYH